MSEPSAEVIEAAAEAIREAYIADGFTWLDDERWLKLARAALNAAGAAVERGPDYAKVLRLIRDLDRCGHGRHVLDVCSYCERLSRERGDLETAPNFGNQFLPVRIGTDLEGRIVTVRDLWDALKEAETEGVDARGV